MGKRGFKPEPVALKRAKGNPGKRALIEDVQFLEGEPDMPGHLTAGARRIWRELVPVLLSVKGLLTVADGYVLGDLCELRDKRLSLTAALRYRHKQAVVQAKQQAKEKGLKLTQGELHAIADDMTMISKAPSGYRQKDALVSTIEGLQRDEDRLRDKLGLSPQARSGMKLAGGVGVGSSIDPIEAAISTPPPDYVERVQ